MSGNKKHYDLIVSLGGNCTVAHNLLFRKMRYFSLPFDWVYIKDTKPIDYLTNAFGSDFSDFLLKENIVKVEGTEEHQIIYKDTKSGYFFPNHFCCESFNDKEYQNVYSTMKKRIDRMLSKIKEAKFVLFVLATSFEFDIKCVTNLLITLRNIYPDKHIDIRVMQFAASSDLEIINNNIVLNKYSRNCNNYDFTQTNYEWSWMDNLDVTKPNVSTKKRIMFLFTSLIPIKSVRKYMRAKYHVTK
jgi:hypothetical protein